MLTWQRWLCDVAIRVQYEDAALGARVERLWTDLFALRTPEEGGPRGGPALDVAIRPRQSRGATPLPATGQEVFRSPSLHVWRTQAGFRLACADSVLDLNVPAGRADAAIADGFWDRPLQEQRELFLTGMLMLLRPLGRYGLHANGLLRDGRGVLLAGDSGCGKTTLTLALAHAGWSFLSDDAVALRRTDAMIEALAFRRGLSCTEATRAAFPGLAPAGGAWAPLAEGKWLADSEASLPGRAADRCAPVLLLFPEVARTPHTRLEPLSPTAALAALLRQSAGILVDTASAAAHLRLLGDLVEQAAAYRCMSGTDVYEDPEAVSALVVRQLDSDTLHQTRMG